MKIESIKLKNFKNFSDLELTDLPDFCIFVGANGTGKSTLFSVFEFLQEAFVHNINIALNKLGGSKGFHEVQSRGKTEPIEITIKYQEKEDTQIITYFLRIIEENGRAIVDLEELRYGSTVPINSLYFKRERNFVDISSLSGSKIGDISKFNLNKIYLESDDTLAIKGLAMFNHFPKAVILGKLIRQWHISNFQINKARGERVEGDSQHLSRDGDNLPLVVDYLYTHQSTIFQKIINRLKNCVPGITQIESKVTEEGRVLLKFKDETFKEPFLAPFVSDGTIKMLAYLVLLHDPKPYSVLCVEEPENQLYPTLLEALAEEFRLYTNGGSQVFVSTHSPDFLNAAEPEEVFWLEKGNDGFTRVFRASENEQIRAYMSTGDKLGRLWKERRFGNVDPV